MSNFKTTDLKSILENIKSRSVPNKLPNNAVRIDTAIIAEKFPMFKNRLDQLKAKRQENLQALIKKMKLAAEKMIEEK